MDQGEEMADVKPRGMFSRQYGFNGYWTMAVALGFAGPSRTWTMEPYENLVRGEKGRSEMVNVVTRRDSLALNTGTPFDLVS